MAFEATRLLYYDDAYLREFEAEVLQVSEHNGRAGMILDRTAFYPTGGGQPSDRGVIKGSDGTAELQEAQWNKGYVLHLAGRVSGKMSRGDHVVGLVDWSRRYSLMRNHTAAHIMAEAVRLVVRSPVEIVGSGLDVDKARLDLALNFSLRPVFAQIEEAVNVIVRENRPVKIGIMKREVAEKHVEKFHESLKTLPDQVIQVRVVEVEGVHACACGGTHVRSTGEIGVVRILGRSSKGRGVERLEFSSQNP